MLDLTQLVLVPVLFGLVGFIEPCSIGGSAIFVSYLNRMQPARRVREATQFLLTRALFLGAFGLAAAFVGARVGLLQRTYDLVMGSLFIVGGIAWFLAQRRGIRMPGGLNVGTILAPNPAKSYFLGAAFGLSAPLCAAPLLLAILAQSFAGASAAWQGFVMMALFGVALSLPLVVLAFAPNALDKIRAIGRLIGPRAAHVGLAAMLIVGAYLIWAGVTQDPLVAMPSMDASPPR